MITCKHCGKQHQKTTRNCCWISCDCGKEICGGCGSLNIRAMDPMPDDDEARYWCCKECGDCGLTGCAMCI